MSSVPLHYVDLRAFSYVTEDEQRVATALGSLLPEGFDLERTESAGHHGAPIVIFSARVEETTALRSVLDGLGELPAAERETVGAELDERVTEDCTLFLSLDKQAAAGGEIRLGEGLTVRAKIEAYPAKHERAVDAIETAGVL